MVENEATEHLLHRRLLLCAREASPALHGSVLSSARPHPAQPTVSHAVTPRLCNCQRGRGRAAGTAASHLRPRDPAPTPPRSSLPPGRSRRRGFLGHRGYARNAAASSQMQSSCPGTASPRPDRGESRAHPGLGQGKGSQEEAESPESHRCPPGHSTAHPVPTARGLHGAQLSEPLSPLWDPSVGGVLSTVPAPPPVPVLQGHQASPQAPSDTSMEPCTDRTEGEHSALQPPCFCFPLRVALAMLFLAQRTAGGTFTSQSLRGHRNALGWMQGCPVGHTGCSQGQWPHSPVPKRKMDLTRMQGRSGHHGHTRAIMWDPPHPADLWHSTDSSPPPPPYAGLGGGSRGAEGHPAAGAAPEQ